MRCILCDVVYGIKPSLSENYVRNAKYLEKEAMQGDTKSQYYLAFEYEIGRGVEKSVEEADKWYSLAFPKILKEAENGPYYEQERLAEMYATGLGVDVNREEAIKIFKKAHDNYQKENPSSKRFGETALMVAVYNHNIHKVKLLVETGFDVNESNEYGNTALHVATGHNLIEITKYLISKGADVNAVGYKGRTPIVNALEEGYTDIIKEIQNADAGDNNK